MAKDSIHDNKSKRIKIKMACVPLNKEATYFIWQLYLISAFYLHKS